MVILISFLAFQCFFLFFFFVLLHDKQHFSHFSYQHYNIFYESHQVFEIDHHITNAFGKNGFQSYNHKLHKASYIGCELTYEDFNVVWHTFRSTFGALYTLHVQTYPLSIWLPVQQPITSQFHYELHIIILIDASWHESLGLLSMHTTGFCW